MSNSSHKSSQVVSRKKPLSPLSIRLSEQERTNLEELAGGIALSAYIKSVVFKEDTSKHRQSRNPVKDYRLLAEVLAHLGSRRIGERLEVLADACANGTLYVDEQTKSDLQQACHDIHDLRHMLMKALGFQFREDKNVLVIASQDFAQSASSGRKP